MLKLSVSEQDGVVQDATVAVRWTFDEETAEKLKGSNHKMGVLLVVVPEGSDCETWYHVAPLDQLMQYVPFHRPGKNLILGAIVRRGRGFHAENLIGFEEDLIENGRPQLFSVYRKYAYGDCEVIVPRELFAKEPPQWEKKWMELWFEPAKDRCQYRARRPFVYLAQPLLLFLWALCATTMRSVVGVFLLLCGFRGVNLEPILHPFQDDMYEIWHHMGDSVFNWKFRSGQRMLIGFPFAPIVLLACFTTGMLLSKDVSMSLFFVGAIFLIMEGIILGVWGVLMAVVMVATLCIWIAEFFKKREQSESKVAQESSHINEIHAFDPLLLSSEGTAAADISALPPEKRTLTLRIQNLKAKYCKPFAR